MPLHDDEEVYAMKGVEAQLGWIMEWRCVNGVSSWDTIRISVSDTDYPLLGNKQLKR